MATTGKLARLSSVYGCRKRAWDWDSGKGVYQGVERRWLRFYDTAGDWILTPLEQENQRFQQEQQRAEQAQHYAEQERQRAEQAQRRAEQERQQAEREHWRAEQAQQRAERLAARLRALGIEPDEE
jgi:alpha-galactosidase/6-phospho-beta-glucosidase family protein